MTFADLKHSFILGKIERCKEFIPYDAIGFSTTYC